MRKKCSFSVSTFALFDLPLREAIERLVDDGWKSIEIVCEKEHAEILYWSDKQLGWLRDLGLQKGIAWSLHAPVSRCNPAAPSGLIRVETYDKIQRSLHVAKELRCSHVVMHPGKVGNHQDEKECYDGIQHLIQFLQPLLEEISGTRTVLALENVAPYPGLLGWNVIHLLSVCHEIASSQLGLIYDIGHAHLSHPGNSLQSLKLVYPYLVGVHISDNFGETDDHLAVGEGNIPFKQIVSFLKDNRFKGSWIIETGNLEDAHVSVERLQSFLNL